VKASRHDGEAAFINFYDTHYQVGTLEEGRSMPYIYTSVWMLLYHCGSVRGRNVYVYPEEVTIVNRFSSNGSKVDDGNKNIAVQAAL
jgi:hypothetical protein